MRIDVNSIFYSINGEVTSAHQGSLCTFIRLQGCNLRCKYCDTAYAQAAKPGAMGSITMEKVGEIVQKFGCSNVTITGGEPLFQRAPLSVLIAGLKVISEYGVKFITVETNGSFNPYITNPSEDLAHNVDCWVMDYKLPCSGEMDKMNPENFALLTEKDFVKFVIADVFDMFEAVKAMEDIRKRGCKAKFAFSPVLSGKNMDYREASQELLSWLSRLGIKEGILSLQLHKIISVD